ncbi:MAG: CDP-alcohol phosphatidyltransferase family protein [Gemmatimonadaceae bacterium]
MFDEPFRRLIARAGAGPAHALHRLGVTPNQVTMAAFLAGIGAAIAIGMGQLRLGGALWIAGRILDGYDGLLARVSGQTTLFGGFLDITLDMLAYSAMAIAFALAMPDDRVLWLIVLAGYVMAITTTLALSSLLERADRTLGGNRSIHFTAAPAEGGETTVVYALLAFFPAASPLLLLLWIALLGLTLVSRTALAYRLLK